MLLSINDLRDKLEEQYVHSNFDLSDLRLIEPGVSAEIVRAAEEQLDVEFPVDFFGLLTKFDFSRLMLANLIFQYGTNLEKLIKMNLGDPTPWWGEGSRPTNLLLVGFTDGHAVLLSLNCGDVIAVERGDIREREQICIAKNFDELVRLAGSLALGRSRKERVEIADKISGQPFWRHLAAGTA